MPSPSRRRTTPLLVLPTARHARGDGLDDDRVGNRPADDSDGVDWAAWQAELRSAVSSPADDESWTDDLDESDEWSVTESASLDGRVRADIR